MPVAILGALSPTRLLLSIKVPLVYVISYNVSAVPCADCIRATFIPFVEEHSDDEF